LSGVTSSIQDQIDNISVSLLENGTVSGTTTFATTGIGTLTSTSGNPMVLNGTFATGATFFLKSAGSIPVVENLTVSGTTTVTNMNVSGTVQNGTFNNPTVTGGTVSGTTIVANDNVFTLQDNTTPTKKLQFELSGITAANTRTVTMFDGNVVLGGTRSVSKTGNYTLVASTDDIVYADATGGAFTLTFPAAASNSQKVFIVKKTDSSFNAITLSGTGMTTNYLMTVGETAWFQSDGSSWVQIYRKTETAWLDYTPVITWTGGVGTPLGKWKRVSNGIMLQLWLTTSGAVTPSATALRFQIPNPSSWTIDSSQVQVLTADNANLGFTTIQDAGIAYYHGRIRATNAITVEFAIDVASGTYLGVDTVRHNIPFTWAVNDSAQGITTVLLPMTNFSP
jgi:hypothetical protein